MTAMTTTPETLLATLQNALTSHSMLEIDGLHASEFFIEEQVEIECMDGRERKVWRFTMAQVDAATFDNELQSWVVNDGNADHRIVVMSAFVGSDEDDAEDE
jgi:hypothetical protein